MTDEIKWRAASIPARRSSSNMWCRTIPAGLIRAMRTNPGQTFQLLGEDSQPVEFTKADCGALVGSCPRPYRVESRAATPGSDKHIIWVSMDPAHWENVDRKRGKNK